MKSWKLVLIAILAVTITRQATFAFAYPTIYATWGGWSGAVFNDQGVGYATGTIWPNPSFPDSTNTTHVAVGLGGDKFTTSNTSYNFSATGSFNTWCVDITHWLIPGQVTYAVGSTSDLAGAFGSTGQDRVNALQKLANEDYSTIYDQTGSAAFQIATWAIMFGQQIDGVYSLNGSTFDSPQTNPGYSTAQEWLNGLATGTVTGNYSITYLYQPVGIPDNTQDMVVFTSVPEPGTILLLGAGLLGLGFYGRERAKKA